MTEEELIDFFENLLRELKDTNNEKIIKIVNEKLKELKNKVKTSLTTAEFF
jgi:hypothetical protein